MKTTSFGVAVSDSCADVGIAHNTRRAPDTSASFRQQFINILDRIMSRSFALGWSAGRETERRRNRNPPAFRSFHEYPLRDAARSCVFLCRRVAVRSVHDACCNREYSQVSGNERVRPRRVPPRTPVLVSE